MKAFPRSLELLQRARNVMPGGVSSALRSSFLPHPLYFSHGTGAHIFDVDGNRYIDFTLAWGPLIVGHGHPHVRNQVGKVIERGQTFGAQHELEVRVAERVHRIVPCAEMVLFSNTGTEAVQIALRLARAHTGRQKILKFEGHYHGWSDAMLISYRPSLNEAGPASAPVPVAGSGGQAISVLGDIVIAPWNDPEALARLFDEHGAEIAAVIAEPVVANTGLLMPSPGFLETLRSLCDKHGSMLIFDEVITGFRVSLGGAQELFGVVPDLAVYAKALAGGFVLSMVCGRRQVMGMVGDGRVVHAGTYNGNLISLAAADATLDLLEEPGVYFRLNALGQRAAEGLRAISRTCGRDLLVHQVGPIVYVLVTDRQEVADYRAFKGCDQDSYRHWVARMLEQGVLLLPDGRWYFSTAHTHEHVDHALAAFERVISEQAREEVRRTTPTF